MTTPTAPQLPLPLADVPRERGWWRLGLAVLIAVTVPLVAQLRVSVPVEQTILLIAPVMAACALAAWVGGGRVLMLVAWGVLAAWMLLQRPAGAGAFDALSRGWALLLAGAFGVVSITNRRSAFLPRALMTLGLATAVGLLVVLATGGQFGDLGRSIADEFGRRLEIVSGEFAARAQTEEWRSFVSKYPGAGELVAQGERQIPLLAGLAMSFFPALLALESLALLALGWALFHRSSRTRVGPPLRRLAEFRFNDQLVWGMVLGITILVLPSLDEARGIGRNLVLFFGALYALRGLGVLSWFLAPGKPTPVLLVVASVVAGPVVGIFTLGLGLVDTWIDWRGRMRPAS